jgi:hypothetical protein
MTPTRDPVTTTLRSSLGYYLCAEGGGGREVMADRTEAGPWEQWTVSHNDDGTVSLQAQDGHYLTAEIDGTVACRADVSGEWERYEIEVRDDAIVCFKSHHGTYLQAPEGGGPKIRLVQVDDDPPRPGEWEFFASSEKFWAPPPVLNPNYLAGVLDRIDRVVSDETGPRILMGCHFMEGFSAYCHGKAIGQLDVATQLDIIAEKYAFVRNLDVLGFWDSNRPGDADEWDAWKGREVTPIEFVANSGRTIPPTPDYWERKREYVTMLHDRGLKIFDDRGDMNAWTHQQKIDHMLRNGQFYAELPFGKDVLAGVWAINEAWQNGGDDRSLLLEMIDAFDTGAGWLPALVGLSSPGGSSDPDALAACDPPQTSWEPELPDSFTYWSADPASVITCHGNRGDHTHIVEHYFGYGYDEEIRDSNKPVQNTEPVGGGDGVSVGQVNDPELLCALTAAALLGGQGWTFMSGNGVFWNGAIHEMPGFEEVARLPQFLPTDIATFPVVCHAGTRFAGVRILAAVDPTRAEHAIAPDGRFVIVVHTQEQAGNALPCERACSEFTVINMLTGAIERTGPLAAGQTYQHPGVARLVVGRLEPMAASATMSAWAVQTAPDKPKRRGGRLSQILRRLPGRGWTA